MEELTRDAFWDVYKPGADEHWSCTVCAPTRILSQNLDFVALDGDEIVGSILYSRAAIMQPDGTRFPIVIFGPLSVHPDYQRRGVGSALVRHSLEQAREMGFAGVALTGSRTITHASASAPAGTSASRTRRATARTI